MYGHEAMAIDTVDYTKFSDRAPNDLYKRRWWKQEGPSLANAVSANVQHLKHHDNDRSIKVQRKAKKLNKFIEGLFYEKNAQRLMSRAFKDALIFEFGAIKVFVDQARQV